MPGSPPYAEGPAQQRGAAAEMDTARSLRQRGAPAAEEGGVQTGGESRGSDVDGLRGVGELEGEGASPHLGALGAPISYEEYGKEAEQLDLVRD